jgi:integrase
MTSLHNNPKLSPSTEKKALRLFSAMMTLAVRHRRLLFNPCEPVEAPEDKVGEMLFLTEAQVADLAEALGQHHEPWRALVLLAGYGGLRWGECIGLPLRHVDTLRSRVRVAQQLHKDGRIDEPKTSNSVRTVNLPKWLTDELSTASALREPAPDLPAEHTELVFYSRDGTPLVHGSTFNRRWWRPAVEEALPQHLHGLRFHDLRHTAVAIALHSAARSGHPLNALQLQERMGHSSIQMTLGRYGHLFEGHDDKLVEAMTNPFADRPARHLRAV